MCAEFVDQAQLAIAIAKGQQAFRQQFDADRRAIRLADLVC